MDKENLIQITAKLYKITLLFPKKEPLRYKLREAADDILTGLIKRESEYFKANTALMKEKKGLIFNLKMSLDIINSYFEVAKWQNWVSYFIILEIQEEYAKIAGIISKELEGLEESKTALPRLEELSPQLSEVKQVEQVEKNVELKPVSRKKESLDERKQKILAILSERERIQVWEVNKIFPNISKRTIRRDFAELLNRGLLERKGENNNTFYQLKKI